MNFSMKKLAVILLVLLVVSLATAVVLMQIDKSKEPDNTLGETQKEPSDTEPSESGKSDDPQSTPSSESKTSPSVTEPPETKPVVTEPKETSAPETKPSETDPKESEHKETDPKTPAPENFEKTVTFSTDTGTRFNLRAVCTAKSNEDGSVLVNVSAYLDYSALGVGSRKATITVNGNKQTYSVDSINEESNGTHTRFIGSFTSTYSYGDTVSVKASYPFRGSYSGVSIENLTAEGTFSLTSDGVQ